MKPTHDLASAVNEALKKLRESSLYNQQPFTQQSKIILYGDIEYPYVCHPVEGQADSACELTAPKDLPDNIKDIYLIDPGLTNVYATEQTLLVGVQACVYSKNGESGTVTVSGMSAKRFNTTRPNTPNSQHNFGKAFDVKLQGRMKSNGDKYDKLACAYLCLYCVEAGATKVIFSDQEVVDAVNKATKKNVCIFATKHENHIHMDCR
ncbi:hypothetical protein EH2_00340 [Bacillus subtilis]|uniref:hypothetical protein n=1 Tax=Bacillus subtilis TaxID=1423 RepID=UPI000F546FA6|nr:hypothetical protein [Bacillus subtilis]RPK21047.1 hypothetical protein EH2_00340 [Bacillus subtilis]